MRTVEADVIAVASQTQVASQYAFLVTCDQIEGAVWAYTSPTQCFVNGQTYQPARIMLKDSKEGGEGQAETGKFVIECDPLEPFNSFVGRGMPFVWNVQVFEVYFDSEGNPYPDLVAEGDLTKTETRYDGLSLTFVPLGRWMNKKIPVPLLQIEDGRLPWGSDFGLDPDANATDATVYQVQQNVVFSAAASAQPQDYYRQGIIQYTRTISGFQVLLRRQIITNIPSPETGFPQYGYFLLDAAPYLLDAENSDFQLVPGYNGSAAQSVGTDTTVFPTFNFWSHVLMTVLQVMQCNNVLSTTGSPVDTVEDVPLHQAFELYGLQFDSLTFSPGVEGTDYVFTSGSDTAPATITFLHTPNSIYQTIEMKWGTATNSGFTGFPQLPWLDPVTMSQVSSKAPPTASNLPTIAGYATVVNSTPYAITGACIGQTISIIGANFGSGGHILIGGYSPDDSTVVWGSTKIQFVVPAGPPLTDTGILVSLVVSGTNTELTTSDDSLNIVPPNTITNFDIGAGVDIEPGGVGANATSSGVNQTLAICGNGFGTFTSLDRGSVILGSNPPLAAVSGKWFDNLVLLLVPNFMPYNVPQQVVIQPPSDGATAIYGPDFTITGLAGNLIDHFENIGPNSFPITSSVAGCQIRIVGSNFGANRKIGKTVGTVTFQGLGDTIPVEASAYTSWSNTLIVVTIPTNLAASDFWVNYYTSTVTITVTTASGLNQAVSFVVAAGANTPWIDSCWTLANNVKTQVFSAGPGDPFFIVGENFGSYNKYSEARFLDSPLVSVQSSQTIYNGQDFTATGGNWTQHQIKVTVPQEFTTGDLRELQVQVSQTSASPVYAGNDLPINNDGVPAHPWFTFAVET